jgi:hypothetical protein
MSVPGGGVAFETVTAIAVETVLFPAASLATAVTVWDPLATADVFQDIEYGDDVSSAPTFVPSNLNCTPMTPTLSDAVAESVMTLDTVVPPLGAVRETVGATVSADTEDGPGTGVLPESAQESRLRLQLASTRRRTTDFMPESR